VLPLLLSAALLVAEPSVKGFKADVAWISAGMAADLVSTEWALRTCPTCQEANPIMQSTGARLLLKTASATAASLACRKLRKDGHPKAATVFRWVVTGALFGIAARNVHTARGAR